MSFADNLSVSKFPKLLFLGLMLLWSGPVFAADTYVILGGNGALWGLAILLLLQKKYLGARNVAAIGGLGISLYLGIQHGSTEASACNVSSTINCDLVNRSVYSEIMGVPIAFLGAAFYGSVLALGLLRLQEKSADEAAEKYYQLSSHLIFAGSIIAVVYSLVLAIISGVLIKAWCLFCIGLYGINLILFFVALSESRALNSVSLMTGVVKSLLGKDDKSLGAALGSYVLILLGALTFFGGGQTEQTLDPSGNVSLEGMLSLTENPLELDGTEPVLGQRDARFTVVEFADYECPHCGRVAPEIKTYVEENKDVKLLFKHYPISNSCNPNVPHSGHENACVAALASECALAQGNSLFWKLNRLTFKNQVSLERSNLDFLAKQVGLDMVIYASCMEQPETLTALQSDIAAANSAGLSGTPSFYLSGHREGAGFELIEGGVDEIKAILEAVREDRTVPQAKAYTP